MRYAARFIQPLKKGAYLIVRELVAALYGRFACREGYLIPAQLERLPAAEGEL